MENTQQKSAPKNVGILEQLMEANPLMKSGVKQIQKNQNSQIDEAMQNGVPTTEILKQLVTMHAPKNPMTVAGATQSPNGQIDIQQGGWMNRFLQAAGGVNNVEQDLKNLLTVSQIQRAPMEMQAESRRLAGEERRQKESERESIRQFGRSVSENQIPDLLDQYGVDVNTMVETYGIPAQIDKATGERRWNLPDMYTQATMAKNKPTTPEERKYIGDIFNAVDTTQEIIDDMAKLGIKDPSEIGSFEVPEGFWSDMGPISIPARFNLAGQYAKDPKYSALKSKIERMFQQYRIVVTGAQASDKELKSLRPLIISMTQRPGVFFATANDLVSESTRNADTRLQLMESAGRDTRQIRDMLEKRVEKKQGNIKQGSGKNYVRTGKNKKGQRVGQLADGTIEVINE